MIHSKHLISNSAIRIGIATTQLNEISIMNVGAGTHLPSKFLVHPDYSSWR